jgi:hypothetical protein
VSSTTNSGFTVIEVTLFLAISSALVVIAIIGTGNLMTSIRFSDSMRSTHAYIQRQYDEILNGVNPRAAEAICGAVGTVEPGKSQCLLLGKLINFEVGAGSLQTYYVVSTRIPDLAGDDANLSDEELLADVDPIVVKGNNKVETFDIPWGARMFASKRLTDGKQVNTYMLLRSPRSSRLVPYTFNMSRSVLDNSDMLPLRPYLEQNSNIQKPTNFCVESIDSPDPPAAITVAGGEGQSAIDLRFNLNNTTDECDGNL